MEDQEKNREICDLLMVWFYIKKRGLHWPEASNSLEERINLLAKNNTRSSYEANQSDR